MRSSIRAFEECLKTAVPQPPNTGDFFAVTLPDLTTRKLVRQVIEQCYFVVGSYY